MNRKGITQDLTKYFFVLYQWQGKVNGIIESMKLITVNVKCKRRLLAGRFLINQDRDRNKVNDSVVIKITRNHNCLCKIQFKVDILIVFLTANDHLYFTIEPFS